ncbi:MAG: cobalt-precorrin-5B (C(1))-methyltransferase CbiD [Eubacteriales bacterium]|jgi:cobalt-precorrin-5B (C1)-methyltransferase
MGKKQLRSGYTTGSCAAAAAQGAAWLLLTGQAPEQVELVTPEGPVLTLQVLEPHLEGEWASCTIRKDGGDDPDVTHGMPVVASVRRQPQDVTIDGGQGVGRVTRPGLDQPVGAAAINSTPRAMIRQEVGRVCRETGYTGGVEVVISLPWGERLAAKTFNPQLGIVGGLSVLGTGGIVHPMSEKALIDTIEVELRMVRASGSRQVILTPGNYGERFLQQLGCDSRKTVKCSNFVGDALDAAVELGMEEILLVGHLGKFVKLAGGMLNTHSRYGDCRMEILAAHSGAAGAPQQVTARLLECVSTDDAVEWLQQTGWLELVLKNVTKRAAEHVRRRAGEACRVELLIYSNVHGILGMTPGCETLAKQLGGTL